jgi:hypothetical protein
VLTASPAVCGWLPIRANEAIAISDCMRRSLRIAGLTSHHRSSCCSRVDTKLNGGTSHRPRCQCRSLRDISFTCEKTLERQHCARIELDLCTHCHIFLAATEYTNDFQTRYFSNDASHVASFYVLCARVACSAAHSQRRLLLLLPSLQSDGQRASTRQCVFIISSVDRSGAERLNCRAHDAPPHSASPPALRSLSPTRLRCFTCRRTLTHAPRPRGANCFIFSKLAS